MKVVSDKDMKPEYEKFLESEEQKYIDMTTSLLRKTKGEQLQSFEKSRLDIIHGYVKQITTIHQTRYMINKAESI